MCTLVDGRFVSRTLRLIAGRLAFFALPAFLPGLATGQVVTTPEGTVEFIGMKRWTVEMVRDSIAKHAPGEPLGQCAGVLQRIGFPAASALHDRETDGSAYVVVTVVEPPDSGRVRHRVTPSDSLPDVATWKTLTASFRQRNRLFQLAVGGYAATRARDTATIAAYLSLAGPDAERAVAIWRFLDAHRSGRDRRLALDRVAHDRNPANSATAIAVLANFTNRDDVWWALAEAQTDRRAATAATATQVLSSAARWSERPVDWRPALPALHAIFSGTNVFVLTDEMEILRRTRFSPALAPNLLRGSGAELLLASLAARHGPTRDSAHRFLVYLAGRDLGFDPSVWSAWIASLPLSEPQ